MKKIKSVPLFVTSVLLLFLLSSCPDNPEAPAGTNSPPTGSAGIGKTVLVGEPVSIDGTANDPDEGTTLSYQWTITSAPAGSAVTGASITNPTTLNASFTPDLPGIYTVQLSVNDGVDTASFEADIRAVGFAIGLNNNLNSEAAYIHNGNFNLLDVPDAAVGGYYQNTLRLLNGTIYCGGGYLYTLTAANQRPVFWIGTTDLFVSPDLPDNHDVTTIIYKSGSGIQLIVNDRNDQEPDRYWIEGSDYMDSANTIIADPAWDNYITTNLFLSGNDVFQIGFANNIGGSLNFFMAQNRNEIVHSASYNPDPLGNVEIKGMLFVRDKSDDTLSKVYLYGNYMDLEDKVQAGYEVNGGSDWVTLYHNSTDEYNIEQYVSFMASPDDYILNAVNEGVAYKTVFVDGFEATMEYPHAGEADVTVTDLDYIYMEEVGGSIFVAGGYHYSNDPSETYYNAAVIWRDGVIVAEEYNSNPDDGWNLASIVAADFE